MKKIIFMLAFVLISSFGFANETTKKSTNLDNKEIYTNVEYISTKGNTILNSVDFDRCRITHIVVDSDGNELYSATYVVNANNCQAASNFLKQRTRDRYNELFN